MALESEVETLKLQIKNINHQVANNTKRFDTKQNDIKSLQSQIKQVSSWIQDIDSQLNELNSNNHKPTKPDNDRECTTEKVFSDINADIKDLRTLSQKDSCQNKIFRRIVLGTKC